MKTATKGQKQILEDNKSTIKLYLGISSVSLITYLLVTFIFFFQQFTFRYMFFTFLTIIIYIGAIGFMKFMAQPSYSETGSLVDGGLDLNMEAGMAEYAKDIVILTAGVQLLSLISNYFILLWFAAPGYASYLIWVNILGPWIFAPAPEEGPVNEKKQKKLDRRMKRMQ
ncbi:transmembrane protein 208-like isoform X2 [Panonychus citri]|uniref:transmembrane protein 208-like isoform X2 n=1 Tax=Panonychus citri TaxID=50023 RepID=UPI002307845B|nr:transmembrane protein 208-like isoform X2 [Panonychus citri]